MQTRTLPYVVEGQTMQGFLAYDDSVKGPRPAVVIAHAWRGQDDFAREKALAFAKMGYVALAADLFGEGITAKSDEESLALMLPLFADRKLLQRRIVKAVELLKEEPLVDPKRIAGVGYCFGGLTMLELLRSGAEIAGVVSCHGLLADVLGEVRAKRPPIGHRLHGSILFLHGADDPMVSDSDIRQVTEELDEHGVDWQFNTYSQTVHAFTNPDAKDPDHGTLYNARTAKRSWRSLVNFLEEIFQE